MTNLINKLLAFFNLKLVSTKLNTSLVKESVKFLDQHKDYWNDDAFDDGSEFGEILFARTLLEQIGVEFEYPVMKKND